MEYLAANINPILEPLVVDLLIHRPADPAQFIADWIQKNHGKKPDVRNEDWIEKKPVQESVENIMEADPDKSNPSDPIEEDQKHAVNRL